MFLPEFTNFTANESSCCNFPGGRAPTPQPDDYPDISPDLDAPESHQSPPSPPAPPPTGRRKADAEVPAIHPALVLSKVSGRVSHATFSFVDDVSSRFQVPVGELAAGVESDEFRAGLKRRAENITRSQCEIYSFSEKFNLSEAARDELIASVGNVSTILKALLVLSI